ncbi:MAG TPA: type II secretion system protein [Gemmatimonadales bacterium]|nr:type II secretion system protein [Gemmatimonadales bacterium]
MTRSRRRGFTLIELVVALAISGLVVLLGARTLVGVADSAEQLAATRTTLDRNMNARRWLIEAFGSLDVGTSGGGFTGRADRVEFAASQRVSQGWLETRPITVSREGDSLVANVGPQRLTIARAVRSLDCDYLLEPGASTIWVREWISAVSAPLAVRLRIGYAEHADTLLLFVGPRG